jgi:hypothetical protein
MPLPLNGLVCICKRSGDLGILAAKQGRNPFSRVPSISSPALAISGIKSFFHNSTLSFPF